MNFKRDKAAQARQTILNVYLFFRDEKAAFERLGETPFDTVKKTWDGTGVSKNI